MDDMSYFESHCDAYPNEAAAVLGSLDSVRAVLSEFRQNTQKRARVDVPTAIVVSATPSS